MMEIFSQPIIAPLLIFILRVLNNVVGTFRIVMLNNNHRGWGFALASLESLLFAFTAAQVITDLEDISKLTAYVIGFAAGGYVSTWVENHFLHVFNVIDIIATVEKGHEIAQALRDADHGVTETIGEGRMGEVMTLRIVAHHRDVNEIINITRKIKPEAFITVEESRYIQNGWIHAEHQHRS
jgi:uncharacterized protein YebE (UPF0316 family)